MLSYNPLLLYAPVHIMSNVDSTQVEVPIFSVKSYVVHAQGKAKAFPV